MARTSETEKPRNRRRITRQHHHRKEDDDDDAVAKTSMEDCPPELIFEILKRSSVRSLLRLRSVCKEWNHTITSLDFKRRHYNHNKGRLLIHWRGCSQQQRKRVWDKTELDISGLSLFRDETLEHYDVLDHSLLTEEGPLEIYTMLGPCNGVFFVAGYRNKRLRLFLWNISTRKFNQLPSPPEFSRSDEFGFGMDPSTHEFKIVLIHFNSLPGDSVKFFVYTSPNNSWRYFDGETLLKDCGLEAPRCGTTFSQGYFYWMQRNTETYICSILAFDMHNEVFQNIEFPSEICDTEFIQYFFDECDAIYLGGPGSDRQALLHSFEDTLALIYFKFNMRVFGGRSVDLWLMKEQGCWTKLFCLQLKFDCYRPLGFWIGERIIFTSIDDETDNERLVVHDPNSDITTMHIFPGRADVSCGDLYMCNYKESLFSV